MIKKLFLVLLTAIAFHFISSFCIEQTDGFTLRRIYSDLTYHSEWATPLPVGEEKAALQEIFSQKFHYLGCGGQCFAFASEDDKYVLKLFKHKLRRPLSLTLKLPSPFNRIYAKKWGKIFSKLNRDFNSYKLAYDELKEETGLLYIHLNKTDELNTTLTIVDKLGICHSIDLDGVEFLLQKKADMAYARISDLAQKQDLKQACASIDALLEVIISRCKKGIYDEDARLHRNFGFIAEKAVVIDVGRFRKDLKRQNPAVYQADLHAICKRFHSWLEENHPELVSHLEKRLYPNNLKNWEFDKEAPQNFCLEPVTIADRQGTGEDKNSAAKPTPSKPNFSGYLGIHEID